MFLSVMERQRAILEDGCHHTVVWQRYCRKLTFQALGPTHFNATRNVHV